jgi:hypothetical protein
MSVTLVSNDRGEWETLPKLLPSSAEDVYAANCHVLEIHLVNETASPVTVTISDKQTTPRAVAPPAVVVPGNGDLVWEFSGRYCPGGLTWVASAASSITGYVRGR